MFGRLSFGSAANSNTVVQAWALVHLSWLLPRGQHNSKMMPDAAMDSESLSWRVESTLVGGKRGPGMSNRVTLDDLYPHSIIPN